MERAQRWLGKYWPWLLGGAAAAVMWILFQNAIRMVIRIVAGAALMAAILSPLMKRLARRLPAPLAAAVCVMGMAVLAAGIVAAALPFLWRQLGELLGRAEEAQAGILRMADGINAFLAEKGLPRVEWQGLDWSQAAVRAGAWLGERVMQAGGALRRIGETGMMALVAFYMLKDMEDLKIRLEWLLPRSIRGTGLRMAAEIRTELGAYLRGQALISLAVGLLAAAGMFLAGTPGAGALGGVVGLFNLIPYFGPVIGGAPAVLLALGKDIWCAAWTLAALVIVQQIDGYVISPRFMGQSTGLHPALVLLGITFGGAIYGAIGMLLAVPCMLSIRAMARIWRLRYEM